MTTEWLDVFDEQGAHIGTATRQKVHAEGLWHQTFHCWVVSGRGEAAELLFQLRHKDKDTYPGMLDVSCAGHLLAGEKPEDGVRELEEELGLSPQPGELTPLGSVGGEYELDGGIIDREMNRVYMYRSGQALSDYRVQLSEVSGLFRVKAADFRALLKGEAGSLTAAGMLVDEQGRQTHVVRDFVLGDFTPNNDDYYELLFQKLDGESA